MTTNKNNNNDNENTNTNTNTRHYRAKGEVEYRIRKPGNMQLAAVIHSERRKCTVAAVHVSQTRNKKQETRNKKHPKLKLKLGLSNKRQKPKEATRTQHKLGHMRKHRTMVQLGTVIQTIPLFAWAYGACIELRLKVVHSNCA